MQTAIATASPLRQDVFNDLPVDVGQAEVTAGIAIGQALVIESQ